MLFSPNEKYIYNHHLLSAFADPRVKDLPFMNNPLPTLMLVAAYLSWVLVIGPLYMRDRKPMNINRTIIVYNAFQVSLSAYMFYEVSTRPPDR